MGNRSDLKLAFSLLLLISVVSIQATDNQYFTPVVGDIESYLKQGDEQYNVFFADYIETAPTTLPTTHSAYREIEFEEYSMSLKLNKQSYKTKEEVEATVIIINKNFVASRNITVIYNFVNNKTNITFEKRELLKTIPPPNYNKTQCIKNGGTYNKTQCIMVLKRKFKLAKDLKEGEYSFYVTLEQKLKKRISVYEEFSIKKRKINPIYIAIAIVAITISIQGIIYLKRKKGIIPQNFINNRIKPL